MMMEECENRNESLTFEPMPRRSHTETAVVIGDRKVVVVGTTCPAVDVCGVVGEDLAWNAVNIDLDILFIGTKS